MKQLKYFCVVLALLFFSVFSSTCWADVVLEDSQYQELMEILDQLETLNNEQSETIQREKNLNNEQKKIIEEQQNLLEEEKKSSRTQRIKSDIEAAVIGIAFGLIFALCWL